MKTLYIVRHAKSSWDDISLADVDRPLNDRGNRDAPRMAKRMKEREITLDLMMSSPANRAITTCLKFAEVLKYPKEKIKTDKALYHASEEQLLSIVQKINDGNDTIMIFGHNPGLTEFANQLMNEYIDNIPTCGIIACKLTIQSWKEINWGKGNMLFFDFPKNKI